MCIFDVYVHPGASLFFSRSFLSCLLSKSSAPPSLPSRRSCPSKQRLQLIAFFSFRSGKRKKRAKVVIVRGVHALQYVSLKSLTCLLVAIQRCTSHSFNRFSGIDFCFLKNGGIKEEKVSRKKRVLQGRTAIQIAVSQERRVEIAVIPRRYCLKGSE